MSFAYLPLYTGDYLRDTADLTATEHGMYLLLLIYSWDARGPIPIDEARAARIAHASTDAERVMVRGLLERYFVRNGVGWNNPRLDKEIGRCNAIAGARSEAGKAGAAAAWGKRKGKGMANAMANAGHVPLSPSPSPYHPHPHPHPHEDLGPPGVVGGSRGEKGNGATLPPTKPATSPALRATRLGDAKWFPPDPWIEWAVAVHKIDRQKAVRIGLAFRDYWISVPGAKGCKLDWLATWRNWIRKECGE
jgi:uncharacterized protein YdaU (DUF1376 family)